MILLQYSWFSSCSLCCHRSELIWVPESRSQSCSAQAYVMAGDPPRGNPWTQVCSDARAPASQPSCLPPPVASSSAVMGRSSGKSALSIVGKVVTVLRMQRCSHGDEPGKQFIWSFNFYRIISALMHVLCSKSEFLSLLAVPRVLV